MDATHTAVLGFLANGCDDFEIALNTNEQHFYGITKFQREINVSGEQNCCMFRAIIQTFYAQNTIEFLYPAGVSSESLSKFLRNYITQDDRNYRNGQMSDIEHLTSCMCVLQSLRERDFRSIFLSVDGRKYRFDEWEALERTLGRELYDKATGNKQQIEEDAKFAMSLSQLFIG